MRFAGHAATLRHEWNEPAARCKTPPFRPFAAHRHAERLAASHIGEWVSQFRQALPDTAFYVELDYSAQMSNDLMTGELDLAVLYTPRHLPDLHYEMVGEVSYRMVSTQATRLREITAARYFLATTRPPSPRRISGCIPDLSQAPIATGQNAAMCGLIASLGGSAYVLEESARELVASGACRLVEDAEPIAQPVYFAVHLRNRHKHRKALAIVKKHFGG